MSTLYRAQILLEPEQHQILTEIAQEEGRSLSDLVREIVREHLARQDREAQLQRELQAIEALSEIRRQVHEAHGVYAGDLIAEGREERDQDMERVWNQQA